MTEQGIILTRLLDKYEKSKHLLEPGSSNRRVMLRIDKKELPEYKHETASIRDAFNQAAQELEQEQLISAEWLKGRPCCRSLPILKIIRWRPHGQTVRHNAQRSNFA